MAEGEGGSQSSPMSRRLADGIRGHAPYPLAARRREGLRSREIQEVLESVFVETDPVLFGFAGVLVELCRTGEGFIVVETAAGTGNRILSFWSEERDVAYRVLRGELDPRHLGSMPITGNRIA